MRKFITLIAAMCLLFQVINSTAQTSGTLVINVNNLKNEKGKVMAQLFRKDDDIPEKPFMKISAPIIKGKAEIKFQNLPFAQYAMIVFHDENDNGILDHKWGFPNESMGFSNEWKLSLFSGMPNFEKLKFEFSQKHEAYDIAIR